MEEFTDFAEKTNSIKHVKITSYQLSSSSLVDRGAQRFKNAVKKARTNHRVLLQQFVEFYQAMEITSYCIEKG